ncbi:MAG: hypothetical protein CL961_00820 [Euryarchaeota archaeon]|nr:hypothetical protein [Euryarchaeota archaeon]|tara:strand:- start:2209 stop:3384 length:1176 start_codon:yes stop_codon:yes gene_type:complete
MKTLGIFTVKYFCFHQGEYYTYGGFGSYLNEIRKHFEKTILVAHVQKNKKPPNGFYKVDLGTDLSIVHLPPAYHPLKLVLCLPIMVYKSFKAIQHMDLVHARMPDYTGVIGAFLCKLKGTPVFCQIIDDWFVLANSISPMRSFGLGVIMKLYLYIYDFTERLAAKNTLVFAQGRTAYLKHKNNAETYMTISTAHRKEEVIEPSVRFKNGRKRILNVGRLNGVKNQALIIHALKALREKGEDWAFDHIGEGNRRESLEKLTSELGLQEYVQFHGKVAYGDALWKFFDRADVFVLSSRSEGTPKVILEALARGLPVVASSVSGVPDTILNEERGLLFEDNNPKQLLECLKRMSEDRCLREKCQSQGSEFAIENSIEIQTQWTVGIVRKKFQNL